MRVGGGGGAWGGSYAAVSGDATSVFWNPAGIATLGEAQAGFHYNALLETSYSGAVAFARPLSGLDAAAGFGLVYFSQSPLDGFNDLGDPTGSFTPYDLALSGAVAKSFSKVHAGAQLKVIHQSLAGYQATGAAADFGLIAPHALDIGEGPADVGLSVQNIGTAMKLGAAADPLPFKAVLGLLWKINPDFSGLADLNLPADNSAYLTLGGEWRRQFSDSFRGALRGGYNGLNARGGEGLAGFTGGAGLSFKSLRLDYAWVPFGELGTTQRLSLAFQY